MMVAVRFPDGSIRHVPGHLREIDDPLHPGAVPTFELVPLNCDSNWLFQRQDATWHATARASQLIALRPATPEWWRSVLHMNDPALHDGQRVGGAQGQRQGQRSRWDSAA